MGASFPVKCGTASVFRKSKWIAVQPGEPLGKQCVGESSDIIARVLRYVLRMRAEVLKNCIYGVVPVKELPHVDAGGAQAKTMTGVGVEEDGPVVKLLPEHNVWIGYWLVVAVVHGSSVPFPATITPAEYEQPDRAQGDRAIHVPGRSASLEERPSGERAVPLV
jgi:hypothetical protein